MEEKFFEIEGSTLFLEKVFVEFDEQPIFFLCANDNEKFLCVCTDMEEEQYIIVKTTVSCVIDMLKGKITMYQSIMKSSYFWQIIVGTDVSEDVVQKDDIGNIDISLLPQKDAVFKLVTDDLKQYCSNLEKQMCNVDSWATVSTSINDDEFEMDIDISFVEDIIIEESKEILNIGIQCEMQRDNLDIGKKKFEDLNSYLYNISTSQ